MSQWVLEAAHSYHNSSLVVCPLCIVIKVQSYHILGDISGSYGSEYESDCLLGYYTM